ncbi:MAG: PhoU domain-containing protein [Thermoplasmata archaeon]
MKQAEPSRGAPRRAPSSPDRSPRVLRDSGTRAIPSAEDLDSTVFVTVRADEPPEHVFRRLLGAYLGGAREFVIRESPVPRPSTRAIARTFCRRTRQPEIVSDDGETILIRDLAFESPVPLERRLEQMGRLVLQFHREASESWRGLPLGEDDSWDRRDDEIDREAWYLERKAALRLRGPGGGASALELWTIARCLERIADHAVILGESGRRLAGLPQGAAPLSTLEQFHRQAMDHLEGVLGAPGGSEANELLDTGEALLASGRAIAERLLPTVGGGTLPPAAAAAVARLLESIGRTIAYSQDIAQVALDRHLGAHPRPRPSPPERTPLPAA